MTRREFLDSLEDNNAEPLVINHDEPDGNVEDDPLPVILRSSGRSFEGQRSEDGGTGWFPSSLLIVNAALGAGLLNFPSAFHQAGGVLTGVIVQAILLAFIASALVILQYCSDWNDSKTLQDVLSHTWGRNAEKITSICVALYSFGTCVTFLIIIGDQFDRVFASLHGQDFCHYWFMSRSFTTISTAICFVLPFCYSKKIDFLKHISSVGVVAIIYVVILVICQYYSGNYPTPSEIKTKPDAWTDVFLVIPTICFGYQCHVSVIPIYSCFKRRTMPNFVAAITVALLICVFTYTATATYGYLTFGSRITSDVLSAYDAHDPYVLVAIIAISIKTYTTYPILSFCGNAAISDLWMHSRFQQQHTIIEEQSSSAERFRIISITIWFIASLIFAVALPNIGAVIKLLGSLAAVFIFIFPGFCLLRIALQQGDRDLIDQTNKSPWLLLISGIFLAIGSFLFGCVFTQAILYDFIYPSHEDMPLCV